MAVETWWNPDYNRPPLGKPVVRAPRNTRPPQPAHVTEQEVMQCIRTGMQTAGEIKQHLGLSRESVSRPLRSLYRAGRVKPVGKRMVGNGHGGRVVVWGLV